MPSAYVAGFQRDTTSGALLISGSSLSPEGILAPPDPGAASLNFRKAVAKARLGQGPAALVDVRGDSTTYGVLSGTNPLTLLRKDYVWTARARQLLAGGSVLPGVVGDSFMQFANLDDTRFTYTGGGNFGTLITGQTMVLALEAGYDTVDLRILRSGAAGNVVVSGAEVVGSPLTLALSGVTNNQVGVFRVPLSSAAAHTITLAGPASGTAQVLNLEPSVLASPSIIALGGVGISGQTLATLAPGSTGSGTNMEKILRQLPAQLHLLMGVNDMRGSADLAAGAVAYRANLDAFVLACQAQGTDPVLWTQPSYFSNQSGVASSDESVLFHQAVYDVARTRNCWVIDLARRWGYGVGPTTGFATTPATLSALYDGTHPTLVGYWDMGGVMAKFLTAVAG